MTGQSTPSKSASGRFDVTASHLATYGEHHGHQEAQLKEYTHGEVVVVVVVVVGFVGLG